MRNPDSQLEQHGFLSLLHLTVPSKLLRFSKLPIYKSLRFKTLHISALRFVERDFYRALKPYYHEGHSLTQAQQEHKKGEGSSELHAASVSGCGGCSGLFLGPSSMCEGPSCHGPLNTAPQRRVRRWDLGLLMGSGV